MGVMYDSWGGLRHCLSERGYQGTSLVYTKFTVNNTQAKPLTVYKEVLVCFVNHCPHHSMAFLEQKEGRIVPRLHNNVDRKQFGGSEASCPPHSGPPLSLLKAGG